MSCSLFLCSAWYLLLTSGMTIFHSHIYTHSLIRNDMMPIRNPSLSVGGLIM